MKKRVRFLVVGGHAVVFHGYLREMNDLDVLLECSETNAVCTLSALNAVGISVSEEKHSLFSKPLQQIKIEGRFNCELLTSIDGLSFGIAYSNRCTALNEDVCIPVLSLSDLIAIKQKLGRPKDLKDVEALRLKQTANG